MKRSQINRLIERGLDFVEKQNFHLPPWSRWQLEKWLTVGVEADEIRKHGMGWAITDFGSKDFDKMGLLLFIIRNGLLVDNKPQTSKTYAEKIMIVEPEQVTPWHFHWHKTEDLINRGGGRLEVELAWAAPDEKSFLDEDVDVQVDGITRRIPRGGRLLLQPGESVTLPPRLCHKFYGHSGDCPVLAGEVSSLNDDTKDNCFMGLDSDRGAIEEDVAAKYCLTGEYRIGQPLVQSQ